ncbi:hypothetical protein LINPERPRIM_LOCUS4267 [Linum perenne]
MGCCISKTTKLKKTNPHFSSPELSDKLVISQFPPPIARTTPPNRHSRRISPIFPLSPTHSSSSFDSLPSFSRRRATTTSSSGSCSSVLTSKDRSFSNEFLWSCVKENPQILYLDSIKESSYKLAADSPVWEQGKQSVSNLQKRVRSSSPSNLTRKKSFRGDYCDEGSVMSILSPSPSRRFSDLESRGISSISIDENCSQRVTGGKLNAVRSISPYVKRDESNFAAPVTVYSPPASKKKNRETVIHRISSKIDVLAVAEAMARYEGDFDAMEEDIDNPMISLDCFIFL